MEAADLVRQAGMVWGEALGAPLLFQESSEGIPVSFVFDERMETAQERQRRTAEIEERARVIEEASLALEEERRELDRRRAAHDQRTLDFEERNESHLRSVEYWNSAGGAPPAEFARLQAIQEEIAELGRVVNAEAEAINGMVDAVNREAARINGEITTLNQARISLDADFPSRVVESAEYRQSGGGFFSSSARAIDVFHFEDRDHLIVVLAHVLGHAMGLDHTDVPDALMEATATTRRGTGRPRAHAEDIAMLRTLCPEL